ncbi:MAG: hypothetical protein ACYCOU_10565 [Sulfobacillus sp.]
MYSCAGFYSTIFFLIHMYIFCEKYGKLLYLDDRRWGFKHTNGFEDYFVPDERVVRKSYDNDCSSYVMTRHGNIPNISFTLAEYREHIPRFYRIRPDIVEQAEQAKRTMQLPDTYDAIFVRWGDKLVGGTTAESRYIGVDKYFERLAVCSGSAGEGGTQNVFVHSDDYDEVIKFVRYNEEHSLNYKIYYIATKDESGGTIVTEWYRSGFMRDKKSVDQMDGRELKAHTEKMLIAIELIKGAKNVVVDYQSNVSRFIKLYCDVGRVHNVFWKEPDENVLSCCPSYGFINGDKFM